MPASSILPFETPDVIVEGPTGLYFAAPAVSVADGGRSARFEIPISVDSGAPPLKDAALTLTLVDGARGLEQKVVAGVGIRGAGRIEIIPLQPIPSASLLITMLLIALLGGLILNVMPCVLPVLSLKLLGLIGHDGENQRHVRLGFLASAAGILVAFAGLAAVLVVLKGMGSAVGWGIQFQQPWFLIAMMLLLTLFAANLWGWFEIPVPAVVGRLAGIGSHTTLLGQFGTGVFATLLATPCSAPFVGTAVAFALAHGPVEIFAIFLALGFGFAAPYLLVAALPAIAQLLPRPGRWMIVLRRILGLLLAGTAVWLLTILAGTLGANGVWVVVGLLLAMTVALWAVHRLPVALRPASPIAVIALALAAFVVPTQIATSRPAPAANDPAGFWKPFDEAAIARLVVQGKTVFVDVTADWCVTCIVNKRLVLDSTAVNARLAAPTVVAMQADWTRPERRHRPLPRRQQPLRHPLQCRLRPGRARRHRPAGAADRARRARRPRQGRRRLTAAALDSGAIDTILWQLASAPSAPGALAFSRTQRVPKGRNMAIKVGDKIPVGDAQSQDRRRHSEGHHRRALQGQEGRAVRAARRLHADLLGQAPAGLRAARQGASRRKGVDTIACLSVNDAFVMDAWGKDQKVGDKVMMLADGNGDFSKAVGLDHGRHRLRHGPARQRYAMVVEGRRGEEPQRRSPRRVRGVERRGDH